MARHRSRVTPDQAEVLRYRGPMAAIVGGWRAGKSRSLADWMHDRLEAYPSARHYVVGADLPQLKRGFLQTFLALMAEYEIEAEYSRTEGTIRLIHNGAVLEPLSAKVQERILSAEADTLLLEEPQTWEGGLAAFRIVMSRLSGSPQGKRYADLVPTMRMSLNPVPVGHWVWDLLEQQKAMPYWRFSVRRNYLWPGRDAYIALQESLLDPEMRRVHLDGEWYTRGGSVYRHYSAERHATPLPGLPPLAFDPSKPLLWTHDFNVGLMCSVVAQHHEQGTFGAGRVAPVVPMLHAVPYPEIRERAVKEAQSHLLYALDEIRLPDASSADTVETFLTRWGEQARRVGVMVYGDPSGSSRSQATLDRNWDVIVGGLRAAGIRVEVRVPKAHPAIEARVNATNAQFVSGDGVGCYIDHLKCPFLVRDFQQVAWKEGASSAVIDKSSRELTHLSDAWGYLVAGERLRWESSAQEVTPQSLAGWMSR